MLPNRAELSTRPPPEGSLAVYQAIYFDLAAGTVRSPLGAVGVLRMPGRRVDSIASGVVGGVALDRMSRDEFFAKVAPAGRGAAPQGAVEPLLARHRGDARADRGRADPRHRPPAPEGT